MTVPRRLFALPHRQSRRNAWWLAVGATAAAIAMVIRLEFREPQTPRVVVVLDPPGKVAMRPVDRPPLEVALYGWANLPSRTPKHGARLVLGPVSPSRKRSPADEILALELANASPRPRSGVQRFAVAKGSKPIPAPRSVSPGSRGKLTHPDV